MIARQYLGNRVHTLNSNFLSHQFNAVSLLARSIPKHLRSELRQKQADSCTEVNILAPFNLKRIASSEHPNKNHPWSLKPTPVRTIRTR